MYVLGRLPGANVSNSSLLHIGTSVSVLGIYIPGVGLWWTWEAEAIVLFGIACHCFRAICE